MNSNINKTESIKSTDSGRNSVFELMRLLLMVMIIIHHCIVHGLGLRFMGEAPEDMLLSDSSQIFTATLINSFCICAVNVFILISGYFGIKTSKKKFVFLILTLLFYAIVFEAIPDLISGNYRSIIIDLLFLSHSQYWFVICYLMLMLFTPMLNMMFEKADRKYVNSFIIGLLIISCYLGFLWQHSANTSGYTLLQFILMYSIGRWIRMNNFSLKGYWSAIIYIVCSMLCGISIWMLWRLGRPDLGWRCTYYNNPLIIGSALGLFLFVKNIRFHSKLINKIAKSAFGIYLVQSSTTVSKWLYDCIKSEYVLTDCGGVVYVWILLLSLAIALFGLLFDPIRIYIVGKICNRIRQ